MLKNLLKGNFLAGKKSYVLILTGMVLTWIGFFTGVDMLCALKDATAQCSPPDLDTAVNATWAGFSGIFIRKGMGT